MMEDVVRHGTGWRAKALGRPVAGKTGTAQAPPGSPHGWFVGFFPFEEPRFVICVFLERGVAGDCFVQVGHIGGVVLAVVDFHGAGVDVGLQRVKRIPELRKFVSGHGVLSFLVGRTPAPVGESSEPAHRQTSLSRRKLFRRDLRWRAGDGRSVSRTEWYPEKLMKLTGMKTIRIQQCINKEDKMKNNKSGKKVWKIIDDNKVRHAWQCTDCSKIVYIDPTFHQTSGNPVCTECDEEMTYIHTEIQE
jgi:hypothetical protein